MTYLNELLEQETWRDIFGAENEYQVSNMGRVRSLVARDKWGNVTRRTEPRVLNPSMANYLMVSIRIDGVRRSQSVHVLVATAFHGPRPSGMHCAHRDGDKLNNREENLQWATPAENEAHKALHGTKSQGSKQGIAKLTEDAAAHIKANYRKGNGGDLARRFGVSVQVVVSVAHGRSWKHV